MTTFPVPRVLVSVAALSVAAGIAASAVRSYGQTSGSGSGSGSSHTIHVIVKNADQTTRNNTTAGPIASMIGHVLVVSDDTTMVSDKVAYNEKTGVANSPGSIKIDDPQNTVTGNTGTAYYARRDAVITGNVHITVRPKPADANAPEGSPRRDFKNPVNVTCDNTIYNWRTRVAVLTGHLILKETDRTVTADKGTYYGKDEKVVLEGHVHYTRPNGDIGDTPLATAILTEGHESFSTAALKGIFTVQSEDTDDAPGTTAKPAPAATSGTPVAPPATGTDTPAVPANPPAGAPATTPPAAPTSPAPTNTAPAVPPTAPSTAPPPKGSAGGTGQ